MKQNPWTAKHAGRTKRTPEQVRIELFDAGWHPSMVGSPIIDKRIRNLLLELNEANRKRTMARLMRIRREQRA